MPPPIKIRSLLQNGFHHIVQLHAYLWEQQGNFSWFLKRKQAWLHWACFTYLRNPGAPVFCVCIAYNCCISMECISPGRNDEWLLLLLYRAACSKSVLTCWGFKLILQALRYLSLSCTDLAQTHFEMLNTCACRSISQVLNGMMKR